MLAGCPATRLSSAPAPITPGEGPAVPSETGMSGPVQYLQSAHLLKPGWLPEGPPPGKQGPGPSHDPCRAPGAGSPISALTCNSQPVGVLHGGDQQLGSHVCAPGARLPRTHLCFTGKASRPGSAFPIARAAGLPSRPRVCQHPTQPRCGCSGHVAPCRASLRLSSSSETCRPRRSPPLARGRALRRTPAWEPPPCPVPDKACCRSGKAQRPGARAQQEAGLGVERAGMLVWAPIRASQTL